MRVGFLLTVAICLLSAEPKVADQIVSKTVAFDYRSQIGVASVTPENQLCLSISNPNLRAGELLTLVDAGKQSIKGIHLTVWSGGYPEGRRQWHRYFYLGYDVEPNCTAREARE